MARVVVLMLALAGCGSGLSSSVPKQCVSGDCCADGDCLAGNCCIAQKCTPCGCRTASDARITWRGFAFTVLKRSM